MISGIEKLALARELRIARKSVLGVATGRDKIAIIRRIQEIRVLLSVKAEKAVEPEITGLEPDGKDNEVKTAKGTKIVTGFMVIEASELIVSHDEQGNINPDYPQEMQPRDRARDTSQAQIARIAKNLDPDMLGRTRVAYQGAPIIGKDGVVESGNGRAMAITLAYKLGKADDYRDWLMDIADMYGLNPDKIEIMKQPVLVRVRKTDVDRAQFAIEANQSDMLAMTATEKAKSDAARLNDALVSKLSIDGDLTAFSNRDFIMGFLQSLGDDETAGLLTTSGQPTKQLYDRAQAAVFSKAYNDDRLLELMADTEKPEIGNIIKSLNQAAQPFIKARNISEHTTHETTRKIGDAIELSLDQQAVDAIVKATELLKKSKDSGMPIEELIKQTDMFGDIDPVVAEMALFIKENNRSSARMGAAFQAMAEFVVKELENGMNASMFEDDIPVSMLDVLKAANAQLHKQYGDDVKAIGGSGGFIDLFTETRGQKADREAYLKSNREAKTNETALDSANTQESNNVATVTGIEKLKLVKEIKGIRADLATVASGIEKLKMIKRVKEIRVVLGGSKEPDNFINKALGLGGITAEDEAILTANGFKKSTAKDANGGWIKNSKELDVSLDIFKMGGKYIAGVRSLKTKKGGRDIASGENLLDVIGSIKAQYPAMFANDVDIDPVIGQEETEPQSTLSQAQAAIKYLKGFIGQHQLNAIATAMRGEEKQFFFDKVVALAKHIKKMPKTYDQDGLGDKAIAYLHYFKNNMDWYITERDMDDDNEGQLQAFGLANLGHGGEMGYISIVDLVKSNVEIDLYWEPKTIHKIKGKDDEIEPETENTPVPIPDDSNVAVTSESEESNIVDNPVEEQESEAIEVEDLVQPITGNTELDKQKRKLKSLADLQERMKFGNKIIKSKTLSDEQKKTKLLDGGFTEGQFYELMKPDFAGRIGFADYMLTNNNATIRNTQKRIAQLEAQDLAAAKASSGDSATSYDFDGGSIGLDYGDDRLKVNFDSKPASDMRDKLKQNGFNWSPTNSTWQRKLTDNAISTANYLFGTKIQTAASVMKEEQNKPSENGIVAPAPVVNETPASQDNPMKSAFEAELNALKLETDIETYLSKLEAIAERVDKAGLSEEMDGILNDTSDQLTALMSEAEKKG